MGGSRDSFHFRPPSPPTLYDSAKAQSSAHTPTPVCVLPSALVVRPLFLIPPLSLFRLYIFFVCDGGERERERGRGLSSTVRRRSWSEPTTLSPSSSSSSSTKGRKRHLKLYVYFSPFLFFFFSGGENDTSFHRDVMAAAVFNHDDGSEPVSTRTDTKDGPRVPPPMG